MTPQFPFGGRVRLLAAVGPILSATLLLTSAAQAEVIVDTLGGGPVQGNTKPYGLKNGNTFLYSQFNGPFGVALDSLGNLFIADKTNNVIRKVTQVGDIANSATTTYISTSLSKPVGVAVDTANNLYVLTQSDGKLRKYTSSGTLPVVLTSSLVNPTALALDGDANIFVTQLNGQVKKITQGNTTPDTIFGGLNQPGGIVVSEDGYVVVSDTGNNQLVFIDSGNPNNFFRLGTGVAGFADGASSQAQFKSPAGLAKAPNGTLIVADRGNNRVRLISSDYNTVSTLYGKDSSQWSDTQYPGWVDGNSTNAESREPIAVAVSASGTVFVTEIFYHTLRDVVGANLTSTNNGGGGTNVVEILPPTISPKSGYFPSGQTIFVNDISGTAYYTTDGTEPTTNSTPVLDGAIQWNDSLRDLTSLRVKNFDGTNSSVTISGEASSVNEIGVPRDLVAGPGSTVVVPVVINLRTNDQLRSIQFRLEISPNSGAPAISDQFRPLPITSNDFVSVVAPAPAGAAATMSIASYSIGDTRILAVSALGTNANFFVKPYAAVMLVAVPIPANAAENQSYSIQVVSPSGTSNGEQANVTLSPMAARSITVSTRSYIVGDSSPGIWYNAGDFGDGKLLNADVNNAFYASFGVRVPFQFSDAFDAMDVGRPGRPDIFGGDGLITAYDWQKIYQRSLGLDTSNWARTSARDSDGNHLDIYPTNGNFTTFARSASDSTTSAPVAESTTVPPGQVWLRQFVVGSGSLTNLSPGATCMLPVYVKVTPGYSLASLQFRATLLPLSDAPTASIQFVNPIGTNFLQGSQGPNDIVCSWNMVTGSAFTPQLQGSNLLGYVKFTVPANAMSGSGYKLQFSYTDGMPDFNTAYDCENLSGFAWVQSAARVAPELISEQWKTRFFGSITNALADASADPDADGFSNLQEYQAGTDPLNAQSRLQFSHSEWRNSAASGIALQWLSAPGKVYVIETSPTLLNAAWSGVSTNIGDGNVQEFLHTNLNSNTRFYRVRLQP